MHEDRCARDKMMCVGGYVEYHHHCLGRRGRRTVSQSVSLAVMLIRRVARAYLVEFLDFFVAFDAEAISLLLRNYIHIFA